MSMHTLKAVRMEDMPAHQTRDSLAVFKRTRANGAGVVITIVVQRRGEVDVVGVRAVAQVW